MTTTACAQSQIWNLREVARARKGGFYFYGTYSIEMLMVGGGGGGDSWNGGGGGGAGGLVYTNDLPVLAGTCYPIVVGSGGGVSARGANTTFCYIVPTGSPVNICALGGGNGLRPPFGPTPLSGQNLPQFLALGSGGGGGKKTPVPAPSVPAPQQPQVNCFSFAGDCGCQPQSTWWCNLPNFVGCGRPGGNAADPNTSSPVFPSVSLGGGGGASAPGTNAVATPTANNAGNGGAGICYSISGSTVGYAGGGGAGLIGYGFGWPQPPACGGLGTEVFGGDSWASPRSVAIGPFPPEGQGCLITTEGGIANRGGGGAGGRGEGPRLGGGASAGGSGVVIIRYDGLQRGIGGNTTTTCFSPTVQTIHTFTGSGCFIA